MKGELERNDGWRNEEVDSLPGPIIQTKSRTYGRLFKHLKNIEVKVYEDYSGR